MISKRTQKKVSYHLQYLEDCFTEGIDLKGDKLIGSIIVGVGLPKTIVLKEI